jgi:hypothetical protein
VGDIKSSCLLAVVVARVVHVYFSWHYHYESL